MIHYAVLDLLAEDWVQSRRESARPFGNKPSRITTWWDNRRAGRAPVATPEPLPVTPSAGDHKRAA